MNCDCLQTIRQKLIEDSQATQRFKKPVQKLEIGNVGITINKNTLSLDEVTTQPFEVFLEGQKKPVKSTIQHIFCPWCGKKEIEDESS